MSLIKSKCKRSAVGKIYKTTDGYLGGEIENIKGRRVVVVDQRKDDGAVTVAKIYKKRGKENKIGKNYIPNLTLKPKNHPSLTEDSIVARKVIMATKQDNQYNALYPQAFRQTDDKLRTCELAKVKHGVHNDTKEHRKTYKKKRKRWFNHFRK